MRRLTIVLFLLGALFAVMAGMCGCFQLITFAVTRRAPDSAEDREPAPLVDASYTGCMAWAEDAE